MRERFRRREGAGVLYVWEMEIWRRFLASLRPMLMTIASFLDTSIWTSLDLDCAHGDSKA
jgi:hypothetical protein